MLQLSIVTVCYNAEETINTTMCSILDQLYTDYEYIIIDGNSTDCTNQIIQSFLPKFEKKGITVKYISEKDNGIYDAMNKGIEKAVGEWISFMNADDSYYDVYTLKNIFENNSYKDCDVLYGDTNYISDDEEKIKKPRELNILRNQVAFAHQSAFVKTCIMKEKKFDVSYKLAADYQLFLELWLEHKKFYYLQDRIVSNFSVNGMSKEKSYESIAELRKIRCLHKIPGNYKMKVWFDYIWWIVVHLGGMRRKGGNTNELWKFLQRRNYIFL